MRKQIILLPTIQNTGTWFLVEMLMKHPSVTEFMETRFFSILSKKPAYHGVPQSFTKNQKGFSILQLHVDRYEKNPNGARRHFATLMCTSPTVIPIRDPLGSILTMRERGLKREFRVVYDRMLNRVAIWKEFVQNIPLLQKFTDQIYVLPLDVLGKQSRKVREATLMAMCQTIGLPLNTKYLKEAARWPMVHSLGTYAMKRYYKQSRQDQMMKALGPDVWKALCDIESDTRPFFEQLGYKNLMWWHDYQKEQRK